MSDRTDTAPPEGAASERLAYGVPRCRNGWDSVDEVLTEWAAQRPDLDFSPVGIVTRMARVRERLEAGLAEVFDRFGLSAADFEVIVTLRRAGEPYRLPQAQLMKRLRLTSGTVSVRLERLERAGITHRSPAPDSGRASVVALTEHGQRLFDRVAPVHLANEHRLLSALSPHEQLVLSDLLRRLLTSFEQAESDVAGGLGVTLEAAHVARLRRTAVGLGDQAGLLVAAVAPDSAAARAGIERGDLITALDDEPVRSTTTVALLLDRVGRPGTVTVLRGNDQHRLALTDDPVAGGS